MDSLYFTIPTAILFILAAIFIRRNLAKTTPIQVNEQETNQKESSSQSTTNKISQNTLSSEEKPAQIPETKPKKLEELQKEYEGTYFGSFKLKGNVQSVTAIDFKGSKVLLANTKNEMVIFNLKNWKKDMSHSSPEKFFVSLDNNGASAVCIGEKYYYAALTFDKTIVCFEFKGEGGVYFKEITRFPRNIFKGNPGAMHVSKNEKYIVTTGSDSEAQIDVWSMKGEKLANENTYLIYNYGTSFGYRNILIRGWTSEIKIFEVLEEKDGGFKKLQKKQHLAYEESPLFASVDNRDMYSVSIGKNNKPKIWNLFDTGFNRTVEINESHTDILALKPNKCSIYTFEHAVGHFKTLVVLANDTKFIVTDTSFKTVSAVEGLEIKELYINGTTKSVILGTVSPQSQISLWNLSKDLEKILEVKT